MISKKNHSLLQKNILSPELRYSILIFLFLICRFFIFSHNKNLFFSPSVAVYYLPSYELGFINKAFIGSVFALFTDYLTNDTLITIVSIITVLLLAMISAMLGNAIGKSEPEIKTAVIIFTFLFLTAPLANTYFIERHFGRLDTFWYIFTLIALACLKRPYIKWAIPILCFAAIATHSGYMFTYMPAIAIPLLYEVYKSKFSSRSITLFSLSCFVLISFFVYFQVFSAKVNFASVEELAKYLSKKTDLKISVTSLYAEYFSPHLAYNADSLFKLLTIPTIKNIALPTFLVFSSFSFPLIVIFAVVWKNSIRNAENNFLKFIYILCALAPLVFIPAALFAMDWERWWGAALNCQFIFIFYFVISNEESLKESLKNICDYFEKHTLVLLLILTFSSLLMFSNICSYILDIFDKNIWYDFYSKVLPNYDYSL